MTTWNQRLTEAVGDSDEYRGNLSRLARAVGASTPSVSAWVGAANIRPAQDIKAAYLIKVCCRLNVRPEWVLFGTGQKENSSSIGVNPDASVTDPNSGVANSVLIKDLHEIRKQLQEILTLVKGKPAESVAEKPSHDTTIASIKKDLGATVKRTGGDRHEGEEHGKRRKQPPARGGKN